MRLIFTVLASILLSGCFSQQRPMRSHDEMADCEIWERNSNSTIVVENHEVDCETYETGRKKCPLLIREQYERMHVDTLPAAKAGGF